MAIVPYPGNGIIELTFNHVLPDPLLFVELTIQDNLIDINQAELAAVLKHTQTTNATTTINFQTTAMDKTIRTLLNNNPTRARTLNLTTLSTLINTITGALPTYSQSKTLPIQIPPDEATTHWWQGLQLL